MDDMRLSKVPVARTGMLIRRPVEQVFEAIVNPDGTTFVRVQESGWTDDADKLVRYVADSTQGFTLMLAGLKALLEHDIRLNLTLDRYPKGIEEQVIGE
jgi:uncharacterized protein YndB with AHSA1/START domain